MKIKIGEVIRSIRLSKGISATFMAKKMGFKSVSSYTRIETGETNVALDQAKSIADLLGVDMNEFFCGQNLRELHNGEQAAAKEVG